MQLLRVRFTRRRSPGEASAHAGGALGSARGLTVSYGPVTRFLARGLIGRVARFSVREYPYVARGDPGRLKIGPNVVLNNALLNCWGGDITIAHDAFLGHGVLLLAGKHDYGKFGLERQNAVPTDGHDIAIGEGAWLASHVVVVGPCSIGAHAVIAAGSVVTSDVPAYTIVGGIPARLIKHINEP